MTSLTTLADYEIFVYSLRDRFPIIRRATLTIIHRGQDTAELRGDVEFEGDLRLGVREYLRFDLEPPRILQYSYEVWRGSEKLWTGRHVAVSPRFAARLTVVEPAHRGRIEEVPAGAEARKPGRIEWSAPSWLDRYRQL